MDSVLWMTAESALIDEGFHSEVCFALNDFTRNVLNPREAWSLAEVLQQGNVEHVMRLSEEWFGGYIQLVGNGAYAL